jgi:hypothetical protein
MEQAAVEAAMETLWSQGRTLSAGNLREVLGYGSLRDILKYRNALLALLEDAVEPLVPSDERLPGVPAPTQREKPLCLCGRCGMGRWFEWDVGIWRCELCGIDPPA